MNFKANQLLTKMYIEICMYVYTYMMYKITTENMGTWEIMLKQEEKELPDYTQIRMVS